MAQEIDTEFCFKRGDDFRLDMTLTDPNNGDTVVDLTGWVIRSQVRLKKKLTEELTVTVLDAVNGSFRISAGSLATAEWKVDSHVCDIQFTQPTTGVTSSETFRVIVEEDVTFDDT